MAWLPALAGAIICAAALPAFADPLNGSSLPDNTRWIIHLDVDGARQVEPLWNMVRTRTPAPQQADLLPKLAILERVTGMKLPQDLHDVTLFGSSFDQSGVCLRVHGNLDESSIAAFLRLDPEFSETAHNDHTIMTWRDKNADRLMSVSFAKHDLAVLSSSSKAVADALDTLDGKSAGLKTGSPIAPPEIAANAPQPIVWMAGSNLSELPRAQNTESPLLAQMDAASISIKWINDRALTEMRVTAKSDKAAQQMQSVAQGVKAFVDLAASDEHATARNRLLATMMQNFSTQSDGSMVKGAWMLDVDQVGLWLNTLRPADQSAATVAAPAPLTPASARP